MRPRMIPGFVLGAVLLLSTAPVQADIVNQLNITGGSVAFNLAVGNVTIPLFNQNFTQNGTLLMGQYQAVNGPTPVFPSVMLIGGHTFSIFSNPGPDALNPLPTPSGNTSGNTIQVSLNSLFAGITGPLINGGLNIGNVLPAFATGTFDPGTGAFHIAWDHVYNLPHDFVGVGNFDLNGNAATSPVPLPAAVWLFGTGLAGIARMARLRKG